MVIRVFHSGIRYILPEIISSQTQVTGLHEKTASSHVPNMGCLALTWAGLLRKP